jgi:hypothetical protein
MRVNPFGDGPPRILTYPWSAFSKLSTEIFVSVRGLIFLCLGFAVAYWGDQHFYDGRYRRETRNMLEQIEARSEHWLAVNGSWGMRRFPQTIN